MEYLLTLNEAQKNAVIHDKGPLMIIAGAGSGKTKVLTSRIAHLLKNGIDAFRILALTFTNKAALEMRMRIEEIVQNSEARNLYIGTFHSVFARLLRAEAGHLGYSRNFTIYDTRDAQDIIKTVVSLLGLDNKIYKSDKIYFRISAAKNEIITPEDYANNDMLISEDIRTRRPEIANIYKHYVKKCFENDAMDFDDLLLQTYLLFLQHSKILYKYQQQFQYILIDEYQDTNPLQYKIVKMLAEQHENICVVGDDAQSIYSFRGATIQNILQFKKDYDDATVIKLEQNYRSTKMILAASNASIKQNKDQIQKQLWTSNKEGEQINLVLTVTDNEEGRFVADAIAEQKLRYHYDNNDFAILYRTNAQSRTFEEYLRRLNIPYKIYGGMSFYQRKEIKDFLAYFKVIVNPKDEESLKRIINYPARGIGKTTIEKCLLIAYERQLSLWEVLCQAKQMPLRSTSIEGIEAFVTMIKYLQLVSQNSDVFDIAKLLVKHTGIVKELHHDKTVEGVARYENVQALLNAMKAFTETPDEFGDITDKSLSVYLQQVSLLADLDDNADQQDAVKIMTIHSAKGLEFSCVFIVGMEEGLFPNAMSLYAREDLEEERRLFYVALTRAKEKLWIVSSRSRYKFGNLENNEPSRFIAEIPEHYYNMQYAQSAVLQKHWREGKKFHHRYQSLQEPYNLSNKGITYADTSHNNRTDFSPIQGSHIKVNDEIEHDRFGRGKVIQIEGKINDPILIIDFNVHGKKKIMLNYAKIKLL